MNQITTIRAIGVAYVVASALWFVLEGFTAVSFSPGYNYADLMISDLGVDYEYEGNTHVPQYSPMAWVMNLNFALTACLYAVLHSSLLISTEGQSKADRHLRTARAVCATAFTMGLILVAVVQGGPREHMNGRIMQHQIGATLSIAGGNICSILAGVSPAQINPVAVNSTYRIGCVVLGTIGIVAALALVIVHPQTEAGTLERWSVYTILWWEALTGVFLLKASKDDKLKTG